MSNKCNYNDFFISFDRITILCFCLLSFLLNIIIIISIFFVKNNKMSIISRLSLSILSINLINIFSYTFQWVICKGPGDDNDSYIIDLLFERYACNIQSFLLLFSSLSQEFLIILFFYIINKKKIIKILHFNIFIVLSIIIPIIISIIFLFSNAFGINDEFCYIKKYKLIDTYYVYNNKKYILFSLIIILIRGINFALSLFLLIKIIKYIKKENEKSFIYIINKLSLLFIQLFKLFIIFFFRITSLIWFNYPEILRKICIILSTIDGLLIPLVFSISNGIFCNFCKSPKSRMSIVCENIEEDKNRKTISILPGDENRVSKTNIKSSGYYNNTNNFEISF